jgi:hypothetical protein
MEIPTVKVGNELIQLVIDAYHARIAALLVGLHGIGKSDVLAQAAAALKIRFLVLDLSIMQPIDLAGLPKAVKGVTRFARPSFLPVDGFGLIVFEELNRCAEYMRAPCLQLLTARMLNDYVVPPGWSFAACINPPGTDYEVEELCAALTSRFMQVNVVPDPEEWAKWANGPGGIHPKVVSFVGQCPRVFEDADANPRAWAFASVLLAGYEERDATQEEMRTGLASVVGETWAIPFLEFYWNGRMPLAAPQIVEEYKAFRPAIKAWLKDSQLDLVEASLATLKAHLRDDSNYSAVLSERARKLNVGSFLSDLPADLKREMRRWLHTNDRRKLTIPKEGSN